jgi:hypothetical protein
VPSSKPKLRAWRFLASSVVACLYGISFLIPFDPYTWAETGRPPGLVVFHICLASLPIGGMAYHPLELRMFLAWLANPAFWVGWYSLTTGRFLLSMVFSVIALVLACQAYFADWAPVRSAVSSIVSPGFLLWSGTFAITSVASASLHAANRTSRCSGPGPSRRVSSGPELPGGRVR